MKQKYILELELTDKDMNFGETIEIIEEFIKKRSGVVTYKFFREMD